MYMLVEKDITSLNVIYRHLHTYRHGPADRTTYMSRNTQTNEKYTSNVSTRTVCCLNVSCDSDIDAYAHIVAAI